MADLLECLLQIKGLRETANRVAALATRVQGTRWTEPPRFGGPPASDLLAQMAEIELVHGAWLRLMLASLRPTLAAFEDRALLDVARRHDWDVARAVDRFLAYRRDNLELLDLCSAGDLARTGIHATRREMTVADLVALMLASDAERLAEINSALQGE
jgi:hypothetical protein